MNKSFKNALNITMEKYGNQVPAKAIPLIEETIARMEEKQLLPYEALGFTPSVMELMYQQGYNLFQNGKYQDALLIFNILRELAITDVRYSFAIAATYHHLKDYLNAAANYLICKSIDPLDPIPSYHLYDCFMKADYPPSALLALEEARMLAEKDSKYEKLREKIKLEQEHLRKFLKDYYQKKYPSKEV